MKIIPLLLFLLLNSCTHLKPGQVQKNHTKFGVTLPLDHWQQKSFRGADLFLQHESGLATIFVNAECDKFSDSPLEALTSQLLVDFSDIKYLKQKRLDMAGRGALVSEIGAKIDGVDRFLKIFILRKNRCVYDAIFSSAPDSSRLAADFDRLMNSFWAEADL